MPDFRTACHIHAAVFAALFAIYVVLPGLPLAAFDQTATPGAQLAIRRSGVVLLGIAVILMLVRNTGPSPERRAIVLGVVVIWAGLALFGVQAILRGVAGWTAWGTVAVELSLAALMVPHLRARRTEG
ncbi:hypothetical protein [Roseivivax sediminis]|uniref:DUF4345 domain-containing protein n=1 Tax=Roseivivax sediminis TaxID=936889 RepID=A0A1I1SFS9_9RHOB|nr:hypothetical protein [Roseivivax sediminis]SFD45327.1 hypothetical protein SAMN04515678_101146 [Roseivivax sediminis]